MTQTRMYDTFVLFEPYNKPLMMNHHKTHQTNLWDPLDVPLDPLGPLAPPLTTPERSIGLIELFIRRPSLNS